MTPEVLHIELTTACNAGCIMCPHGDSERSGKQMDTGLVEDLLVEGMQMDIPLLHPHYLGEPTLHPLYPDIISFAASIGYDIRDYTNGSRLVDPAVRAAIINYCEWITISVDGWRPSTMAATRPGIDPYVVLDGVRALVKARGKRNTPKIVARMAELPENEKDRDGYEGFWKGVVGVDKVAFFPDFNHMKGEHIRDCSLPFKNLVVLVNGDVVICCRDFKSEYVLGNAFEDGLDAVWNSERAQEIREMHRAGEVTICQNCDFKGERL